MPSHTTRCLGPRQKNRQCAVLWIVLSVSLLLLPNRLMTVKAGGRATPSFSVTAQSSRQPDGSQDAGKDPPAVGVFEPVDSTELLLLARRTAAQPIPTRQAPRGRASETNATQGDKDLRQLEPGKPIEQKFAGGQSHSYRVTITTGQYLHVVVDQRGIDVALTLFAPDGKQEMDVNLTGIGGLEALSYEATAIGDYRITVRALGAATLSGSYQARLEMRAAATAQDKQRIAAERLLAEANQLSGRGPAVAEQLLAKAQQALGEWQALGDQYWAAYALSLLGIASRSLNRHDNAIEYFEQALKISKEMKDLPSEGKSLNNLGNTYYSMRRIEKAVEYYEQALAIKREVKNRAGEVTSLFDFAELERKRGDYLQAKALADDGLKIAESLRSEFYNRELRSSYFASVQHYYMFYTDLMMRLHQAKPGQGFDTLALQANERARARILLEQLSEAHADIRQGVDPTLLERELILQRQLNSKASTQIQLLSGKHTEAQAAAIAKEIEELTAQYQQVEGQIHATSPRYAALTRPQPLTLAEIQRQVLDPGTLLLEYTLGKERSYLWAVAQNSINVYELPKRPKIEAAARRVYERFSANNPAADKTTAEALAALSRMLLGPVAKQLGTMRLLVVADGILQYLPFGALPAPTAGAAGQRSRTPGRQTPLIVQHEIVSLPSASTLAVLRREQGGRKPAPKQVAVLADPVFDRNDPRVKSDIGG